MTTANEDSIGQPDDLVPDRSLKRELLDELRASWGEGQSNPSEEPLRRWPSDHPDDPDVASRLFEAYQRRGPEEESIPTEDGQSAPPQHSATLASLIRHHDLLRSLGASEASAPRLRLPDVGDQLFGFALRHELGRGAFARVFLAEQEELAGRPVVLKVSAIEGSEPQTLAQLQHTHIVPIYSVHEDPRRGLRAVCMPYFGGISLSRVLQEAFHKNPKPTQGLELIAPLELAAAEGPLPPRAPTALLQGRATSEVDGDRRAPRILLSQTSYVRAAAWVTARLAEALAHAHGRGVLHHDVKPSNVLLGADGQPMLLDFNLAHAATESARAVLGGTVAYMAPEHLRAMASRDPVLARRVDARSDVYSLGMVLYEMLTGHRPFEQSASSAPLPLVVEAMALERTQAVPSPRQSRADVPWGLESIVRKCLAGDPAQRYQRAEDLAEDLHCFLDDRPLRFAPELSWAERGRKWARRHPRLCSSGAVAALALVLLLLGGVALVAAFSQVAASRSAERKRSFEEATVKARFLVHTATELGDHLRQGEAVCREALDLYGVLEEPAWQNRADWQRLNADEQKRLAGDVRELLLLLASARVRLTPGDTALREALALLDRAEAVPQLPPCRALWEDRATYQEALGEKAEADAARRQADSIPPGDARDHYLLALGLTRAGRHEEALHHLEEALRQEPRHYWAWVQHGVCQRARGEPSLAAADFGVCVGLWPEFAWGYFNRASALAACGKRTEAVADYDRALQRDPELVPAYVNRGLARLELEQFAGALADFDRAVALGQDSAAIQAGRGAALERLGRHAEADAAFQKATARATAESREVQRSLRWVYGFAVALRLPREAAEAFGEVLAEEPENPKALYGMALLRDRAGKKDEAIRYYDRALAAWPAFPEARRYRAILRARLGDVRGAEEDVNFLLERDPHDGPALYAAACVAALTVDRAEPALAQPAAVQALDLLRRAFERGYGRDKAAEDSDLDGIRLRPEFQRLIGKK
jgi:serine/threonine protein kinase/tetratricopeptide (TPR) repeat protein